MFKQLTDRHLRPFTERYVKPINDRHLKPFAERRIASFHERRPHLLTDRGTHAVSYGLAGVVAAGALLQGPVAALAADSEAPMKDKPTTVTASAGVKKSGEPAKTGKVKAGDIRAADVVKIARKELGVKSGKKFDSWYRGTDAAKLTAKRDGSTISSYKGAQWCDMFVSWVGAKSGLQGIGADAYTVEHAKWFKKTKRWGAKAKPGSVVFFDWKNGSGVYNIDHVGFVIKDNGNGTIKTIEGNASGAVKEKNRPKSAVVGYGYPDYKAS